MAKNRQSKKVNPRDYDEVIKSMEEDRSIELIESLRVNVKCQNEAQKEFINSIKDNEISFCVGPAGTGKTYLACAQAVKFIKSNPKKYKKICLIKSVTGIEKEDIGFLKGSLREKMGPYVESFMDNFKKVMPVATLGKLEQGGVIEILPIAFARGRTMDNSIVIIDEAQNITIHGLRTLLTRIGKNSKFIIMGDTRQTDSRYTKNEDSFNKVINILKDIPNVGYTEFQKSDVVRNPIIELIENKFDENT